MKIVLPLMFSTIFSWKHKAPDGMEMTSIEVEMLSYSGSIFSSNNYFKAFKNPCFRKFGRMAP